jgi:YfiH family protein
MALPKPSGDFQWTQETWGSALRCAPLSEVANHCFSTRQLSLAGIRDEDPVSWAELARALGTEPQSLVRLHQVHGCDVFEAVAGSAPPVRDREWPEADIAIGSDASLALSVRAADCVPILLADRRTGSVAAVHAGWKGTAAGAAVAAVQAMARRFGTQATDLVAAVGPSIGPCCYEVGEELVARFEAHPDASRWFTRTGTLHLNLWRATRDQLERAGLQSRHIHICDLCTSDHPELFYSYRRDGKGAGRLVAAIRPNPVVPHP